MENYIIAIAIVLSTIIYVFGNRYTPDNSSTGFTAIDKFTGKYVDEVSKRVIPKYPVDVEFPD